MAAPHYIVVPEHGCNVDEIDNRKENPVAEGPFQELLPMARYHEHQRLAELEEGLSYKDEADD